MNTIAFECRFGGLNGWGHLSRCCALAQEAKSRGWRTLLWSPSELENAAAEMREAFDAVVRGDAESEAMPDAVRQADALFVDEMYWKDGVYDRLRSQIGTDGPVFATTDDMQQRFLEAADIVLNPELGLEKAAYRNRGVALLGERYCLLRSGFRSPLAAEWPLAEGLIPIFVMIGGTDPFGHGPRVLEALDRKRFAPVYVCGSPGARSEELSGFSESRFLSGLNSSALAGWMGRCRLGVIGCSTSAFELASLGVPFVGLSVVDNQTRFARKLAGRWDVPVLPAEGGAFDRVALIEGIERLLARPPAGFGDGLDGLGCSRVMDALGEFRS